MSGGRRSGTSARVCCSTKMMSPASLGMVFKIVSTTLAASSVRRDNCGLEEAELVLDLTSRKTRKGKFLDEMERVVPWAQLVALIEPHAPHRQQGRPPFGAEVMLRIQLLQ